MYARSAAVYVAVSSRIRDNLRHERFGYHRNVLAEPDVAAAAGLLADTTRARFVQALSEVKALPASELAAVAGVSNSTASAHLAKLVAGGLVASEPHGRHRYFRLADPAVAAAVEALSLIAPRRSVRTLRESVVTEALREARTCYDHLAGALGVGLTQALEQERALRPDGRDYQVTRHGERRLRELGVDVAALRSERRAFARRCLDWSEREFHLAGAVGAALAERLFELGWLERRPGTRAVRITSAGRADLRKQFGLVL